MSELLAPASRQSPASSGCRGTRRRCWPRIVRLVCWPSLAVRRAVLWDALPSSVGLIVVEPLQAGTMLVLHLPARPDGASVLRPARVRQAQPRANGGWLVDCDLERPLAPRELSTLQGGAPAGSLSSAKG